MWSRTIDSRILQMILVKLFLTCCSFLLPLKIHDRGFPDRVCLERFYQLPTSHANENNLLQRMSLLFSCPSSRTERRCDWLSSVRELAESTGRLQWHDLMLRQVFASMKQMTEQFLCCHHTFLAAVRVADGSSDPTACYVASADMATDMKRCWLSIWISG